jgi:hypothetical protein
MPSIIQGTEVTTFERSSTPGTQLESSAVSISEHDLPYELPPFSNTSIQDTGSHQPTPPEIASDPHGIANILSSAVFAGTSEQSSRKGLLKGKTSFVLPFHLSSLCELDIFFEFSSPRHSNDELTLAIMQGGNFETLRLTEISLTKWKAIENIDLWVFLNRVFSETVKAAANASRFSHDDAGYMMLVVQSKDGGDEAFLAFTPDEIHAMACAEEGTLKTVVCLPYMYL